jgi:SMC interacting uncharacterized protein involved in chromosome segregation
MTSFTITMMTENRIELLKKEIDDLKKRWPAHSVPPALMEQLDELESQLAIELEKLGMGKNGESKEVNQ